MNVALNLPSQVARTLGVSRLGSVVTKTTAILARMAAGRSLRAKATIAMFSGHRFGQCVYPKYRSVTLPAVSAWKSKGTLWSSVRVNDGLVSGGFSGAPVHWLPAGVGSGVLPMTLHPVNSTMHTALATHNRKITRESLHRIRNSPQTSSAAGRQTRRRDPRESGRGGGRLSAAWCHRPAPSGCHPGAVQSAANALATGLLRLESRPVRCHRSAQR